jgi:hypothetical protein
VFNGGLWSLDGRVAQAAAQRQKTKLSRVRYGRSTLGLETYVRVVYISETSMDVPLDR